MSIKQYLHGEMFLALARTFLARGIAALGTVLLGIVLGRLYGADGVGVFALAQSVLLGAGILARYGLDNTLMRYVGRDHESLYVAVYLQWACRKATILSLVAAAAILLMREWVAWAFGAPELSSVLIGVGVAVPAFTLSFVLSGFMKGVRKPATANLLENGAVSLVAAFLIFCFHWWKGDSQIEIAGWAIAIAAWLVLVQGIWQASRWFKVSSSKGRYQDVEDTLIARSDFSRTSQSFLVMSLAQFVQQVVSILIAGLFLSNGDLGLFKVAERVALLISFILLVINAVFPPRFAKLYHQGDMQGLSRLARKGAILGLLMAAPLLAVCLCFPRWVLGWFGPEFGDASLLLRILAVAQLVNVATGSVGYLLNMTGHEKLMRNIALVCNVSGVLLLFLVLPVFGVLGAAVSLAIVISSQNIVALVFVWRKLRIWMLPCPNFLRRRKHNAPA